MMQGMSWGRVNCQGSCGILFSLGGTSVPLLYSHFTPVANPGTVQCQSVAAVIVSFSVKTSKRAAASSYCLLITFQKIIYTNKTSWKKDRWGVGQCLSLWCFLNTKKLWIPEQETKSLLFFWKAKRYGCRQRGKSKFYFESKRYACIETDLEKL